MSVAGVIVLSKIPAYIKAMRPIGWIPFWFSLVLGMIDGGFSNLSRVAVGFLIYGPLLLGGIYMINFYSDARFDQMSSVAKDIKMSAQPFATGEIKPASGLLVACCLQILGVVLSAYINLQLLFVSIYTAIVLTIYSIPPRLKEKPFGDIFANATTAGAASYVAGWSLFQDLRLVSPISMIWVTLLVAATYLLTVTIDIEDDRKVGITTTGTYLGQKMTVKVSTAIYFLSLLFYFVALIMHWTTLAYWILLPPLLKSISTYVKLYRDPSRVAHVAVRAVQSATLGGLAVLSLYVFLAITHTDEAMIVIRIIELLRGVIGS